MCVNLETTSEVTDDQEEMNIFFQQNKLVRSHWLAMHRRRFYAPWSQVLQLLGTNEHCISFLPRGESKPERRSGKRIIAGTAFRLEFIVGWYYDADAIMAVTELN